MRADSIVSQLVVRRRVRLNAFQTKLAKVANWKAHKATCNALGQSQRWLRYVGVQCRLRAVHLLSGASPNPEGWPAPAPRNSKLDYLSRMNE